MKIIVFYVTKLVFKMENLFLKRLKNYYYLHLNIKYLNNPIKEYQKVWHQIEIILV